MLIVSSGNMMFKIIKIWLIRVLIYLLLNNILRFIIYLRKLKRINESIDYINFLIIILLENKVLIWYIYI